MNKKLFFLAGALILMSGCTKEVKLPVEQAGQIAEFRADSILNILGSKYCYVVNDKGEEIPSQITHDGKLIFVADSTALAGTSYKVLPSDTIHTYASLVSGRKYPERADDIAWENELNGYRIYGPATQAKGETAYGYDIFFKHRTSRQILEDLYGPETSPATWRKVDSLRNIDPQLAEDFISSFSYHIDHGLGMDCYAVGPTLGDGVAAILENDTIRFPWCYKEMEVLDNGPLRFTVRLDFAPVKIGEDEVTEHRLISLDAGSYLNDCKVWYDGLTSPRRIAVGFPRRDDSPAFTDADKGIVAYADPTQGKENGKALLGLKINGKVQEATERDGHILAITTIQPNDTLSYRWGFAWDRENFGSLHNWTEYLLRLK